MTLIIVCLLSVLLSLASIFLNYYTWKQRKKIPARQLIKEPSFKINFNPSEERWEWSKLNPKTRTWEWFGIEATPVDCEKYQNRILTEYEGETILADRIYASETLDTFVEAINDDPPHYDVDVEKSFEAINRLANLDGRKEKEDNG